MAGFMAGPLGFASTAGAFIGGAARQGNELFAEQRAQARQDEIMKDQVWLNKFDNAQQQEREATKQRQSEADLLNTFTTSLGGDKAAGYHALNIYRANPKQDITALLQGLKTMNPTPNTASTSPFEQRQQSEAEAGRQRLETLYGRLTPKTQKQLGPLGQSSGPTVDYSSDQSQQPPSNGTPSGTPAMESNGQLPGYPAITPTNPAPKETQQQSQLQPAQGNIGSGFNIGMPKLNSAQVDIINKSLQFENRDAVQRALEATNLPPAQAKAFAQGVMTAKEHSAQLVQQQTASHQAQGDIALTNDDIKKYLHDPKTGLQARYGDLRNLANQRVDIDEMYGALTRGLMASKPQPMFDEINRVVKPLLGIDLADMGVANTISDTTLMKKAISNAIINRLSQLHFGRITNKEAAYVENGLGSTGTDPNTNVKIILAIQSSLKSAADSINKEYNSVYGGDTKSPLADRAQMGRKAQIDSYNEYASQGTSPWPQTKTATDIQNLPVGQWFETSDGTMHIKMPDGRIKNAGDKI